jgi:hypothetical protein
VSVTVPDTDPAAAGAAAEVKRVVAAVEYRFALSCVQTATEYAVSRASPANWTTDAFGAASDTAVPAVGEEGACVPFA